MKLTLYVALDGTPLGLELEGLPWQIVKAERVELGPAPPPFPGRAPPTKPLEPGSTPPPVLTPGAQRPAPVVVFELDAEPVGSEAKPSSEAPSAPEGASS